MAIVKAIVNDGIGVINGAEKRSQTVEIVDCLSSTRWESNQSELVSKPLYWWNGPTGTVTAISSGSSCLRVKVSFDANANETPVKSFCLRCIASDAEDNIKHYLYVYSDGNFGGTLAKKLEMTFTIPINVSSLVIEPVGSVVDEDTQSAIDDALEDAEKYTDDKISALKDEIGGVYFDAASFENNTLTLSRPDGTTVELDLS